MESISFNIKTSLFIKPFISKFSPWETINGMLLYCLENMPLWHILNVYDKSTALRWNFFFSTTQVKKKKKGLF